MFFEKLTKCKLIPSWTRKPVSLLIKNTEEYEKIDFLHGCYTWTLHYSQPIRIEHIFLVCYWFHTYKVVLFSNIVQLNLPVCFITCNFRTYTIHIMEYQNTDWWLCIILFLTFDNVDCTTTQVMTTHVMFQSQRLKQRINKHMKFES